MKEPNGKRRKLWAAGLLFAAALCAVVFCCALPGDGSSVQKTPADSAVDLPLSERITNYEAVIQAIRHGLRNHAQSVTVRFSYSRDILKELSDVVGEWVEEALEETGEPEEGDYIRYQYGGYQIDCSYTRAWGRYRYTVEIRPEYYMYLVQEEEVTAKLEEIRRGFGFQEDTTEYEKVRAIYDYVCSHVKYDTVHRNHRNSHMKSTSYAALIWNTAACQGYCVTLYRMLRQEGINTRVITGTGYGEGREEFHAWNIVELDGMYYNLDATWDAGKESYQYFLKGSEQFRDHVPGKAFSSSDFASKYIISPSDYAVPGR